MHRSRTTYSASLGQSQLPASYSKPPILRLPIHAPISRYSSPYLPPPPHITPFLSSPISHLLSFPYPLSSLFLSFSIFLYLLLFLFSHLSLLAFTHFFSIFPYFSLVLSLLISSSLFSFLFSSFLSLLFFHLFQSSISLSSTLASLLTLPSSLYYFPNLSFLYLSPSYLSHLLPLSLSLSHSIRSQTIAIA